MSIRVPYQPSADADDNLLELTIIRAVGLPDVQKWKLGIQDPFAKIKYGTLVLRTKTHNNGGSAPVWNETFSLQLGADPVVALEVLHDRLLALVNDEIIGTGRVDVSKARELGEMLETVQLQTTDGIRPESVSKARELAEVLETVQLRTRDGMQQGVLECKLTFPSVLARVQLTQQMEAAKIAESKAIYEKRLAVLVSAHAPLPHQLARVQLTQQMEAAKIAESKAIYEKKLADALRMRQKKAAQVLEAHENVIEGSIASLHSSDFFAEHEEALRKATAAYLASTEVPIGQLKSDLDFDEEEFLEQLMKEIEKSEDFQGDIERYVTAVGEQVLQRRKSVSEAYLKFVDAVRRVEEELKTDLTAAAHKFEEGVEAAAEVYKKDAKTHLYWKEEAKAKKDVAAYEALIVAGGTADL